MNRTTRTVQVAIITLMSVAALVVTGSPQPARAAQLPGMCNGRTDPNLIIAAHANGAPNPVPKFILNISTDVTGNPSGAFAP